MGRLRDVALWGEWRDWLWRFELWESSVADFCQWEGVSQAAFYGWRRKLMSAGAEPVLDSGLRQSAETQPVFVQVLADSTAVAESGRVLVVRLAHGHRVELPVGDDRLVMDVIQAVAVLPFPGGDR